jgi:hypothetical protein
MKVVTGQRFRATTDVPVICMTSWAAPFSGGHERTLPKGEIVTVANDPPETATSVYADPENYGRLHSQMVPFRDRAKFWIYRGYYLCIRLEQLEADFELL